jgi:hypothetical protein
MSKLLTVECDFHFERRGHGAARRIETGTPKPSPILEAGRVPRVARLMALAIKFDGLVRSGAVADYAELAELGHVSRARISQIMNLLLLAPDIQEQILFLPRTRDGRDPIRLAMLQPIALSLAWGRQRRLWKELQKMVAGPRGSRKENGHA